MTTVTLNSLRNEASRGTSPQLDAADAFAAHGGDVTLELADLTVGQLSAVAALMLALDAAEARARKAERALATHLRGCVCQALGLNDATAGDAYYYAAERCDGEAMKAAA